MASRETQSISRAVVLDVAPEAVGQGVLRDDEVLCGIVGPAEVLHAETVGQLEVDESCQRSTNEDVGRRGPSFDVLLGHHDAIPEELVSRFEEEPVEIHAPVPPAAEELRVGDAGCEECAGKEDIDLGAGALEIQIEVVHPRQREGIVHRLIPEDATDEKEPIRIELGLDDAFAGFAFLQVTETVVGVP